MDSPKKKKLTINVHSLLSESVFLITDDLGDRPQKSISNDPRFRL